MKNNIHTEHTQSIESKKKVAETTTTIAVAVAAAEEGKIHTYTLTHNVCIKKKQLWEHIHAGECSLE